MGCPCHPNCSQRTARTTQTSAAGVWKKAGSWRGTAARSDPGSVPGGPGDLVSCGGPVWGCVHCFCFGGTNVPEEMTSRRQELRGSCFPRAAPGGAAQSTAAGARARKFTLLGTRGRGSARARPVTVDTPQQTRLYHQKLPQSPNPALGAGDKLVGDISDSKQSLPVMSLEDS